MAGSSSEVAETEGDDASASPTAVEEEEESAFLVVNRQAGMIIVKDYRDVLLLVAEYLEAIEGSIQRQVFIQAKIVEITLNDDYLMGINWGKVSPLTVAHGGDIHHSRKQP